MLRLRQKVCYAKINLPLGAVLSWSVRGWSPCQLLLDQPCAPPGTPQCPQSPEQMPSAVDSLPRGSLRPHGSLPGRVPVLLESIRATQRNAVGSPAPVDEVVECKVLVEEVSLEKTPGTFCCMHMCLPCRLGLGWPWCCTGSSPRPRCRNEPPHEERSPRTGRDNKD